MSLTKKDLFSQVLGLDAGNNGEISQDERQTFLTDKNVKKKKITEQNLTNFLNRVTELSPTEEEKLLKKFNSLSIKDSNGNELITDEIRSLVSQNSNGKIDNIESGFFERGGNAYVSESETFDIQTDSFIQALKSLNSVSYGRAGYNGKISDREKQTMYRLLEGSKFFLKRLKEMPEEVQQQYKQALTEVHLTDTATGDVSGQYLGGKIDMHANASLETLSSTLFHELTHHILGKFGMDSLSQEVETFYAQYKLHKANQHKPDYNQREPQKMNSLKTDYFNHIDKLKEEFPEMSEKEIAVEAFIRSEYFEDYVRSYRNKNPEEQLRNEEYFPLYGLLPSKKPSKT